MRKITAIIIAVLFVAMSFNVMAILDEAPDVSGVSYEIPKAPNGFDIGTLDDELKWTGALFTHFTPANSHAPMNNGDSGKDFKDAKFWFLWSEAGVYFRADIQNPFDLSISAPDFDSAYNRGNGLQFFPAVESSNDLPGWTFHPHTLPDGVADVWRHWPDEGRDTDAKIFVKVVSGGHYIMEGLMPSSSWAIPHTAGGLTIAAGAKFSMPTVILQAREDGAHDGISDAGWFDMNYPTYTLSATQAPGAPPPEPDPEPEAPVAAGGGDEAPEPPPVQRPTAPTTGDAGTIALIALMAAAFGIVVVLRKKAVR